MGRRMYRVVFEAWGRNDGWMRNYSSRDVSVIGGAEQAIKVATKREKEGWGEKNPRMRAESCQLLAAED